MRDLLFGLLALFVFSSLAGYVQGCRRLGRANHEGLREGTREGARQ